MKRIGKFLLRLVIVLAALGVLAVVLMFALRPWYMKLGATQAELSMSLAGDELVPSPVSVRQSGITIQAPPEKIYPWLVQLGAERGGFYSYTILENMAFCKLVNADVINPAWQNPQPGDAIKMCPGTFGPPPYKVMSLDPNHSFVLGHIEADGTHSDTWQFVLLPIDGNTTRLVTRSRTMLSGGMWTVVDPISVLMEQGLLRGVRARAEK